MTNSIIPHVLGDTTVFQVSQDTVVAGYFVNKGYCNLTALLKAASHETGKTKKWSNYFKAQSTQEFLTELARQNNCSILNNPETSFDASPQPQGLQPLIISIKGGTPSEQGTWGHIEVAIDLSRWASPKFAVSAVKVLRATIEGNYHALTEEAQVAQVKLQETWQKLRNALKQAFWSLGDAIKHYVATHDKSEKYKQFIYSNCQNTLNRRLFGKPAKTIREELEVSNLLRDHYGETALRRLDLVQALAAATIVNQGIEPHDATKQALAIYSFEVADYQI
ncbi:MAG: KilA-N domain-containing protein [Symploca sp. SIO2G7]|nr:KilA-N domain-containing protein [Symploca sp. SIO2G7]